MNVVYGVATLCALLLSVYFWSRKAASDNNLLIIYVAALGGAMVGSVIGYMCAEGFFYWRATGSVIALVGGKTIVGGCIGGYISVEVAKWALGYRRVTGDMFATVVPLSIAVGRIGCLFAECCVGTVCELLWYAVIDSHGTPRLPAIPMEIGFNLCAAALFLIWRRKGVMPGQHFHIYMIAYGTFRFFNEFMREDLRVWNGLSGYHLQAVILYLLGVHGFIRRKRKCEETTENRMSSRS